jgi:hypothetical protein
MWPRTEIGTVEFYCLQIANNNNNNNNKPYSDFIWLSELTVKFGG